MPVSFLQAHSHRKFARRLGTGAEFQRVDFAGFQSQVSLVNLHLPAFRSQGGYRHG